MERHITCPGERGSVSIDWHVITTFCGSPARFAYRTLSGEFVECVNQPRAVMITPAGPAPEFRLNNSSEFIHCALGAEFIRRVKEDLDPVGVRPLFRPGIRDRSILSIVKLLTKELEQEQSSGRLYVDSLAHALATRYLLVDSTSMRRTSSRGSGVTPRVLNRVREKIEANLETDLSWTLSPTKAGTVARTFSRCSVLPQVLRPISTSWTFA